jgi:L-threonylcarbamoyladenylate synthase
MTEMLLGGPDGIARAAALLRAGALVAFGTETVYGLGGDATNGVAVAGIFAAKDRPAFNPLICHYPAAADAFRDVLPNEAARRLAAAFWPGPLTLVLPKRAGSPVASLTGSGLDSLAVRVPAHRHALILLATANRPIAAPSANRSGRVSPTTAAHVWEELDGRVTAILDSGPCGVGVESTVLDLTGPRPVLLRPGGLTLEAIQSVCGVVARAGPGAGTPRAPGQLASHYAPTAPVRLNADSVQADEGLLAFGQPLAGAASVYQLSAARNLAEAAARLFDGLRWLDGAGSGRGAADPRAIAARAPTGIAVMPVPETGLGLAINDRLRRAAAPRP